MNLTAPPVSLARLGWKRERANELAGRGTAGAGVSVLRGRGCAADEPRRRSDAEEAGGAALLRASPAAAAADVAGATAGRAAIGGCPAGFRAAASHLCPARKLDSLGTRIRKRREGDEEAGKKGALVGPELRALLLALLGGPAPAWRDTTLQRQSPRRRDEHSSLLACFRRATVASAAVATGELIAKIRSPLAPEPPGAAPFTGALINLAPAGLFSRQEPLIAPPLITTAKPRPRRAFLPL